LIAEEAEEEEEEEDEEEEKVQFDEFLIWDMRNVFFD